MRVSITLTEELEGRKGVNPSENWLRSGEVKEKVEELSPSDMKNEK